MSSADGGPQAFGFGTGGNGGRFDLLEFLKRPQVILRIIAWVKSMEIVDERRKRIVSFFRFAQLLFSLVLPKVVSGMANADTTVRPAVTTALPLVSSPFSGRCSSSPSMFIFRIFPTFEGANV